MGPTFQCISKEIAFYFSLIIWKMLDLYLSFQSKFIIHHLESHQFLFWRFRCATLQARLLKILYFIFIAQG